MRLTLEALAILDAIDRQGSFALAAEVLHRVPSAITYTVQKLEQDLDVLIFDRSGHRARLTPAGRKLLEEGRYLLEAANSLENTVKRMATGWESELRIAVDDLLPMQRLLPLVEAFYGEIEGTSVRITSEVFGGTWDALLADRADLVIGAPGEPPEQMGIEVRPMGQIQFVFVVTPDHPLAESDAPITEEQRIKYRAVAVADTSRKLAPRTSHILSGQDVLTVPTMQAKVEAQRRGLGIGQVPRFMVEEDLASGVLIAKSLKHDNDPGALCLAWRAKNQGKALQWFLQHLEQSPPFGDLFDEPARPL